jgi:UDP-glucuronate decarboxylase
MPFNIGNPCETKVGDLAELICKISNSKSRIVFKPLPSDDPSRRQPDISEIQHQTGWTPQVSLEEGLKETVKYFREVIF